MDWDEAVVSTAKSHRPLELFFTSLPKIVGRKNKRCCHTFGLFKLLTAFVSDREPSFGFFYMKYMLLKEQSRVRNG